MEKYIDCIQNKNIKFMSEYEERVMKSIHNVDSFLKPNLIPIDSRYQCILCTSIDNNIASKHLEIHLPRNIVEN